LKKVVHLASRIEKHRIAELVIGDKRLHFFRLFIGNGENHQATRAEALSERLQIGQLFAARRAPGGPEIHQHHFSSQGS
jgi:hypothetical protein